MAGIMQDYGNEVILDDITNNGSGDSFVFWLFRLFDNDYEPVRPDLASSYHDAVFSGYAPQAVPAWSPGFRRDLGDWVSNGGMLAYVCSADGPEDDIYGWWVTAPSGLLVASGRFSAPIPVVVLGDTVTLSPTLELTS